ncbi:MAG: hypothetical protein CL610_01220 [Anaerolineaceae bacterium]|nr:hypothetical protein [Anaerolineaceae bacterium]
MDKILTITRKELFTTFTDRNLLMLMIAAPLAISTIVGLVFGGFGDSGGLSLSDIPVAVANLDEGADQQGQSVNYGNVLTGILIPQADAETDSMAGQTECTLVQETGETTTFNTSLGDLLAAESVSDIEAARAGVENGDYSVLVVIPPDFSASLSPQISPMGNLQTAREPAAIEVYANSGDAIEGTIVRSIVEGFTNRLLTGNIAIGASVSSLIQQNPAAALRLSSEVNDPEIAGVFACGFTDALSTVVLDPQPVEVEQRSRSVTTLILVQTGSAQAVLFALFAGQFGVLSIINEQRAGTLQRMLVSPTPRHIIIMGKLVSTVVMVIVQILILLVALTVISSIVERELTFIWGSNIIAIAAVIFTLALSVAGLGVLLMGLARTPEQVGPVGAILNILMGAVGGAFGFMPVFPVAYLSLIYWGTDAFTKLSAGNNDIGINLLALLIGGSVFFAVGLFLFNRRVEL